MLQVRRMVTLQTDAFHSPAPLAALDGMARKFFEAEVLSGACCQAPSLQGPQRGGGTTCMLSEQRRSILAAAAGILPDFLSCCTSPQRALGCRDAEEDSVQPR